MNSTALIIEHNISCVWLRSRDAALLLVSGLLWGMLLASLPDAEFGRVSPLAYLATVVTIVAMCLAWAAVSKAYWGLSARLTERRHETVVRPDMLALHFGIDPASLLAIQRGKTLVIQHTVNGQIANVLATTPAATTTAASARVTVATPRPHLSQAA